ncbi:hypothetical protein EDD18DRAFT_1440681 [Armillaria luteobubalina]|uniref:Uncharacterized protein n=1 Tax=Armillaria luteobubalina TaxID=153913 RepID=A0AA39UAN8_9AGAR|nr:hypothetical protein EDD18DRAFT_1440681 [Armillaria luteobubalina]
MNTEMEIDFTLPNSRLNSDPNIELPYGWSYDWDRFDASDCLYPCIHGCIATNTVFEGVYSVQRGEIFIMYRTGSHLAVITTSGDPAQYYIYNFDTTMFIRFTETYPTLEAFLEKARLWVGDDAQINVVTPFQIMDHDPKSRDLNELYEQWDKALDSFELLDFQLQAYAGTFPNIRLSNLSRYFDNYRYFW